MNGLADGPIEPDLLAEALRHVGSRVRHLREMHQLSQQQAAKRAGLNQTRWHRIELGDGTRLEDLLAIQYLFSIDSLEVFFGDCPSRRITQPHELVLGLSRR